MTLTQQVDAILREHPGYGWERAIEIASATPQKDYFIEQRNAHLTGNCNCC